MIKRERNILVSACLLGLKTRYSGAKKLNRAVIDFLEKHQLTAIPVCPEQLGGLPTPRPATQFSTGGGEAVLDGCTALENAAGEDVTQAFVLGAEQTLMVAGLSHCQTAIFKERSPSCGCQQIYVQGKLCPGTGVTTALLRRSGLHVYSEESLPGTI